MENYQPYLQWIADQAEEMRAHLISWAEINSGTRNVAGVNALGDRVAAAFGSLQTRTERFSLAPIDTVDDHGVISPRYCGDALRISKDRSQALRILLSGHLDTVFSLDHPFQKIIQPDAMTLCGPGVADMKGGLVVMLYALKALERSPFASGISWSVLLTPDEEMGSRAMAPLLARAAEESHLGLVYEPAMTIEGTLAGERKGSGQFTFVMQGVGAHAGRDFDKGKNAIAAMAPVISKVHALNGQRKGVTLNVGIIRGGDAINAVPAVCVLRIDVRTRLLEDEVWVTDALQSIQEKMQLEDPYRLILKGSFSRPPNVCSESTNRLLNYVVETGRALQQNITIAPSGGCCDGNNLSAAGLPVVDTLGVCGSGIHGVQECMRLDSLVSRAQLSALLLMRLSTGEYEWKGKTC